MNIVLQRLIGVLAVFALMVQCTAESARVQHGEELGEDLEQNFNLYITNNANSNAYVSGNEANWDEVIFAPQFNVNGLPAGQTYSGPVRFKENGASAGFAINTGCQNDPATQVNFNLVAIEWGSSTCGAASGWSTQVFQTRGSWTCLQVKTQVNGPAIVGTPGMDGDQPTIRISYTASSAGAECPGGTAQVAPQRPSGYTFVGFKNNMARSIYLNSPHDVQNKVGSQTSVFPQVRIAAGATQIAYVEWAHTLGTAGYGIAPAYNVQDSENIAAVQLFSLNQNTKDRCSGSSATSFYQGKNGQFSCAILRSVHSSLGSIQLQTGTAAAPYDLLVVVSNP